MQSEAAFAFTRSNITCMSAGYLPIFLNTSVSAKVITSK